MQLTLFGNTARIRRQGILRNPYRDRLGRFCTRAESKENVERQITYWRGKAEMYERMYLAVAKRLSERDRGL